MESIEGNHVDSYHTRCSTWLRAVSAVGLVGFLVQYGAHQAQAQSSKKDTDIAVTASAVRDIRSRNFLIHTDLSDREAKYLLDKLESMLLRISRYWGRPMQGKIECYVVRDFDSFPPDAMDQRGIDGIRTAEGVTLMGNAASARCCLAKSVVYACDRPDVVLHETVHAYCHQTFGRIGPIWYSEGMAEMGHYWKEGDGAVHAGQRVIEFLRENPPLSLAATLSSSQVTGDSWQNYASRWALCHFLINNPNYSRQFRALGRGILTGKEMSFDKVYDRKARELWFEYLFFLRHIDRGYRVDLCAWNWDKKFACLSLGGMATASIKAGRGWQPTGLKVIPKTHYQYIATGTWRIASQSKAVDAQGDDQGRGRLVGALMKDYRLSDEFELGDRGTLPETDGGDLYLRCRNGWRELADDSGQITVKIEDRGNFPHKINAPVAAAAKLKAGKAD